MNGNRHDFDRYNLDKDLTQVIRPDGQTVSLDYDSGGRLSGMHIARGSYHYSYHPTTGQLTSLTGPDGNSLSFTWDGFLPLSTSWSGEISGTVSQSYDNNFWITGRSVNGNAISFGYDDDGLLTSAGDMSLTRDPANGLLTHTALGNVTTTHQHNSFGEPIQVAVQGGAEQAAGFTYERDKLGRITHKTEVVDGHTIEDSYEYDLAGRLVSMNRNGHHHLDLR
jgi:YD repeat-containing protein